MLLNKAVIPHHRSEMIPTSELKKKVALNEAYLKEKPTWYMIDDKLQYFKVRNDFRLFTELFFSMFGREIMGLDTLEYHVAYVRTINPVVGQNKEETKCGLLSECFQSNLYNYYLVSELLHAEISDFVAYGGYTLENLLHFFKDYLTEKDYKKNELFLIKLFISDAFTHQEDRNYHNIGFKIPKIKGVPYTDRLHPDRLANNPSTASHIEILPTGQYLLKGLSPTKVYDNERSLGTDHKDVFTYHKDQTWCPLFPYSHETEFKTSEQATKESKDYYDGLDPNLLCLFTDHEAICRPYFERLAYDDEYRKILENFESKTSQISLRPETEERIVSLFEDKREVFRRILKY